MKCECCDNEVRFGASQCDRCGALIKIQPEPSSSTEQAQPAVTASKKDKSKIFKNIAKSFKGERKKLWFAYFLWAFGIFGIGGLHRFYTRRRGTGLLWLLTMGLGFLGTAADFILIFVWYKKGCLMKPARQYRAASGGHKKSGKFLVGTLKFVGNQLYASDTGHDFKCKHSPNGKHAFIGKVCRYCGQRDTSLNI